MFFVRKYSVVVICLFTFSILVYSFSFLGSFFFFHFFPTFFLPAMRKGRQTRREATILDERIQNFPFLSFIGHGSKRGGWGVELVRKRFEGSLLDGIGEVLCCFGHYFSLLFLVMV